MMSSKNIKTVVGSIFLLILLGSVVTFMNEKLALFQKDLEAITQQNHLTEDIKPVFYDEIGGEMNTTSKNQVVKRKNLYTLEIGLSSSEITAKKKVQELNKKNIAAFFTPLQQGRKNLL